MFNQWKYSSPCGGTNYYHDENGQILGTITRVCFSDDIWDAEVSNESLGSYIDEGKAKAAVERAADVITTTPYFQDGDTFDTDGPSFYADDIHFNPEDFNDSEITIDLSVEEAPKKKKKK